jgi:hypothetical protein
MALGSDYDSMEIIISKERKDLVNPRKIIKERKYYHLPSKCKALSSNPSPAKNEEERQVFE